MPQEGHSKIDSAGARSSPVEEPNGFNSKGLLAASTRVTNVFGFRLDCSPNLGEPDEHDQFSGSAQAIPYEALYKMFFTAAAAPQPARHRRRVGSGRRPWQAAPGRRCGPELMGLLRSALRAAPRNHRVARPRQ